LVEPGTGHLTAEEISGLIGFDGPGALPEERANHARTCDICRRIIAMHQEEDSRLRRLAGGPRGTPGLRCPVLDEWASLAAGLADPQRRNELLAHASQCDHCGAVLHAVMEDFSEDMTDAESKTLETLESAKPEWQRAVSRRMAGASRTRPTYIRTWLPRAAAVLLAAGAGWLAWNQMARNQRNAPPDPAGQLAIAFTEQRPFEYRIPGAAHASVRQERGAGSSFGRPQALRDAVSTIGAEREKNPEAVKWLELEARAEMLQSDPQSAIDTLNHALEQKPDDPDLWADLGMAYALRAGDPNRRADYGQAIEFLNRSLQKKPNSPEVAFNLALVYEKMNFNDLAIEEWQQYLNLDTAGAWREEAQDHLAKLEQKKKSGSKP